MNYPCRSESYWLYLCSSCNFFHFNHCSLSAICLCLDPNNVLCVFRAFIVNCGVWNSNRHVGGHFLFKRSILLIVSQRTLIDHAVETQLLLNPHLRCYTNVCPGFLGLSTPLTNYSNAMPNTTLWSSALHCRPTFEWCVSLKVISNSETLISGV